MTQNRKGLTLEMLAKLMIGIVITVIGIGLVTHFLGVNLDIPGMLKSGTDNVLRGSYVDPHTRLEVINDSYTEERIAKYIKTCWDRTRDTKQDMPCFALQGNFTQMNDVGILSILKELDPKVPSRTNITAQFATTDMILIYYDYSDDIIDVKG